MGTEQSLGAFLKARREELGFTLRDVERITEGRVSNPALSQIENGKTERPSGRVLWILSAAYGIDGGDLLRRAGDRNAPAEPFICPMCGRAQ